MARRLKVTGYVDVEDMESAEVFDVDDRVSMAAFEEIRAMAVDDLGDLTVEEED